MYAHFGSTLSIGIIRSYDVCPQHTGSTKLSNLKEVIRADTKVEFNLLGNKGSRNSCFCQLIHIFITPSKSITQFLGNVCSGIVQRQSCHIQYTVVRQSSSCFNQSFGCLHHITLFFAFCQHLVEEIITDGTLQLRQVITFLLEVSHQKFRKPYHMSLTSIEIQLYTLSADSLKQSLDVFGIEFFCLYTESQ